MTNILYNNVKENLKQIYIEEQTRTLSVLGDVLNERERQDRKWGIQNHSPDAWISILGEEFGEVCKAANESGANFGLIDKTIDLTDYRKELIEVAAVAIAAIECLDRNKK